MENIIKNEQTDETLPCAAATDIKGNSEEPVSLNKFKDEKSLQKAYQSLEAEFTKRCQRLKALEEENKMLKVSAETSVTPSAEQNGDDNDALKEFFIKYPEAADVIKEISAYAVGEDFGKSGFMERAYVNYLKDAYDKLKKDSATEEYLLSQIEGTSIKDEIIREYLAGVKNSNKAPVLLGEGGDIALSPLKKPRSLREAGLLAQQIIKLK